MQEAEKVVDLDCLSRRSSKLSQQVYHPFRQI